MVGKLLCNAVLKTEMSRDSIFNCCEKVLTSCFRVENNCDLGANIGSV